METGKKGMQTTKWAKQRNGKWNCVVLDDFLINESETAKCGMLSATFGERGK